MFPKLNHLRGFWFAPPTLHLIPAARPFEKRLTLRAVGTITRPGMTGWIAWQNLTHDRIRFAVTLIGIAFSVVLMAIQGGLLYGFATTASSLVDHATEVDFWVSSNGAQNVDQTFTISERRRYQAMAVSGVAKAEDYIVQFSEWKKPKGGIETVLIVGFDLATGTGGPWNVVEGSVSDLAFPDTVIIDRLYAEKLGISRRGDSVEISGHRARIVGFTQSIRTFTQSPYVFTALKNARNYSLMTEDQIKYVLVRLHPDADRGKVKAALTAALPDTQIWDSREFSNQTQNYWLFTTGAGTALIFAAALGLVVGIVITAQTLYASTVDRLPEYAMLRAMGAPPSYLYRIILKQALTSALLGYALGIAFVEFIVWWAQDASAAMLLPDALAVGLALVTVVMCSLAAVISIRKIMAIDPTSVFR